jgi:hypothetical protein
MTTTLRIGLVDLAPDELDFFRTALAITLPEGEDAAREAEVRLVVAPDADSLAWRWATLARVARSGEVAALAGVVLEAVVVSARSARAGAASRLAASLGCRVVTVREETS